MDTDLRIRLLLSAQRALLGAVTPNIRAVRCKNRAKLILIEFIFDGDYSEADLDRCEVVASEVIADFDDALIETRYSILRPPARIPPSDDRLLVYQRFEEL